MLWSASSALAWGAGGFLLATVTAVAAAWAAGAGWSAPASAAAGAPWAWAFAAALATVGPLAQAQHTGAWVGWRASGASGRGLLGRALAGGLVATVVALPLAHGVAPWGHRSLTVAPGSVPQRVGDALVWVAEGRVLAADARGVIAAAPSSGGLGEGRLLGFHAPLAGTFGAFRPARRLELDELATRDVYRRAERTAAAGRDGTYERAVAHKRSVHALALVGLPAALLPFALGRRPWWSLGLVAFAVAVVQRAADGAAAVIGAAGVAGAGPVAVALIGLWGWASWRDR